MKRIEAIEILAAAKGDGVSVATMRAVADWYSTDAAAERHIDSVGCMGAAAPIGFGIALADPSRRVMVIDGDGSLLMELGVLAVIGGAAPSNLYHFVLVNGVYETSGNQPTPAASVIDFPALAKAAGYAGSFQFSDAAVLAERINDVLSQPGPLLIALDTDPETSGTPGSAVNRPADAAGKLRQELTSNRKDSRWPA